MSSLKRPFQKGNESSSNQHFSGGYVSFRGKYIWMNDVRNISQLPNCWEDFSDMSPAGTRREIVCPIKICDFEGIGSLEMIHNAFHMNLFHQPPRIPEMFLNVPFPSRRVKN